MKLHQERSYALALKDAPAVDGMFIGEGGGFSFRTYEDFLLVGGGGHRTGKGPGSEEATARSARSRTRRTRVRRVLRVGDAGLHEPGRHAYIGVHRRENPRWYVATGFSKWGMTGSYVAAKAIAD